MLAAKSINENVWNSDKNLVFVNELNGLNQMISIETINGVRVKNSHSVETQKKVVELFPNGLPNGMNVVFVSFADKNND